MRTSVFFLILLSACTAAPVAPKTPATQAEAVEPTCPQSATLPGNYLATVRVSLTPNDPYDDDYAWGTAVSSRHVLIDAASMNRPVYSPSRPKVITSVMVFAHTHDEAHLITGFVVAEDGPLLLFWTDYGMDIEPVTLALDDPAGCVGVYQPYYDLVHEEEEVLRAQAVGVLPDPVPGHEGQSILSTNFLSREITGSGVYDENHLLVGLMAYYGGPPVDAPPRIIPVSTIRKFLDRNHVRYRSR